MKRLWFLLLSLGIVAVFSMSAVAVDVKFSGEYFVSGMYMDKTTLQKDVGTSTAFYYQRLRVQTDVVIAPGLTLTTRADIMERAWGATRSTPSSTLDNRSAGSRAENENIAFDWAYLKYMSPIGIFSAGYMSDGTWGTVFGNNLRTVGKLSYTNMSINNFQLIIQACKFVDGDYSAINTSGVTDADSNVGYVMGIYTWKTGEAGILGVFARNATTRPTADPYKRQYYIAEPYAIAKFGPLTVQAELQYAWGKYKEYDNGTADINLSQLAGFLDATVQVAPFYFGATFVYLQGDDPATTDKAEGGILFGGDDFNPCLILWNFDRRYWVGAMTGQGTSTDSGLSMSNAWFYQARVGVKPIDKLDIMTSVSYAYADKKPTGYNSGEYGWEVDLTATYKITNNLSYMLGVGYLFTGDYFKGATTGTSLNNDYIVTNKLTLTF